MVVSLQGWQELKCPKCEGSKFVPVVSMIWQNGQGTSVKPLGHYCMVCRETVDQAKMVAFAKKREAEQKIKDLEVELG